MYKGLFANLLQNSQVCCCDGPEQSGKQPWAGLALWLLVPKKSTQSAAITLFPCRPLADSPLPPDISLSEEGNSEISQLAVQGRGRSLGEPQKEATSYKKGEGGNTSSR